MRRQVVKSFFIILLAGVGMWVAGYPMPWQPVPADETEATSSAKLMESIYEEPYVLSVGQPGHPAL